MFIIDGWWDQLDGIEFYVVGYVDMLTDREMRNESFRMFL